MIFDDKESFKNRKSPENNSNSIFLKLIFFWILLIIVQWVFSLSVTPQKSAELRVDKFDSVEIGVIKEDCVLRCLGYTPIYEENGTKNYEVRFRVDILDTMIKCVIPAKEIDELHNIEENAKYKGSVEFAYLQNYVDSLVENMESLEKEDFIKRFLYSNKGYSEVAQINFMYSKYLSEYSLESAQKILIDRWQK